MDAISKQYLFSIWKTLLLPLPHYHCFFAYSILCRISFITITSLQKNKSTLYCFPGQNQSLLSEQGSLAKLESFKGLYRVHLLPLIQPGQWKLSAKCDGHITFDVIGKRKKVFFIKQMAELQMHWLLCAVTTLTLLCPQVTAA